LQGALDADGNLAAWKHFQTSTSIAAKWRQNGAEKPEQGEFGTGTTIPYLTPNIRIEYTLAESSAPRAWWRSVEHSSSGFVMESFIDELAHAAGQDPLAFRLRLIGGDRKIPQFDVDNTKEPPLDTARLKGVFQLAAQKAGWGQPLPKGQGRGIAAFYSFNSYTSCVAEVSVTKGSIKLDRLVYAVDCGRPINPEGIRAQIESAAIYGLSATMYDAITVSGGRVEQSNFHDYQMPRMNEARKIEVHVVMSKEEPTGIGEPGLPVVAPAVCNAIFVATGKRLRRLPIRAEDLA
jgi:isoquinoline 1-oxidoreductase beta subunit